MSICVLSGVLNFVQIIRKTNILAVLGSLLIGSVVGQLFSRSHTADYQVAKANSQAIEHIELSVR